MLNRKRWHTEIAGMFLLWVEEVVPDEPNGPPWRGNLIRRFRKYLVETPDGPQEHLEPWGDHFKTRSKAIAMESAITTLRNCSNRYGENLSSAVWVESEASSEDWNKARLSFMQGQDFELP